jgi:hypothetical protein
MKNVCDGLISIQNMAEERISENKDYLNRNFQNCNEKIKQIFKIP